MQAIFLDRDGVINKYPGDKKYVTTWKAFKFLPKAKAAIARLHQNKFKIFVISNQAGVGKGIFTQGALDLITKNMLEAIEQSRGKIEAVYYCTHRPEENCVCRKPRAGLLYVAKKNYPAIEFKSSFFIGDTLRDVQTAKAAGCNSVLVLSGREKLSQQKTWEVQPDLVFPDFWEAANFIVRQK